MTEQIEKQLQQLDEEIGRSPARSARYVPFRTKSGGPARVCVKRASLYGFLAALDDGRVVHSQFDKTPSGAYRKLAADLSARGI